MENIALFDKIYIDDKLLGIDNYIVEEGSTVIILKNSYLQTLDVDTYEIEVFYKNGVSDKTTFEIVPVDEEDIVEEKENNDSKKEEVVNPPKTYDGVMIYIIGIVISIIGLGCLVFKLRKNN